MSSSRTSLIALGGLEVSPRFYRESLGLEVRGIIGANSNAALLRFFPVGQLLKDKLVYRRKGAPIPLHTGPSDSALRAPDTRTAVDITIKLLAFMRVSGTPWMQVESLDAQLLSM